MSSFDRIYKKFFKQSVQLLDRRRSNGAVIGFLLAHQIDSLKQEAAALFIYEIEVQEEHRRKGAGTALINHILSIAENRQMFEMFVLTNHSNQGATAFYQATGGQIEDGDELMFVYPVGEGQD